MTDPTVPATSHDSADAGSVEAPVATLATAPDAERDRGREIAIAEFGSLEDFEVALNATIKEFDDGSIVEGVVVKVDPDECLLDIGYKSEGVIPSRELSIKHDVNPFEVVAVGDVIEALVLQKEDKEGRLILSKKRAQYERAWGKIEEIYNGDSTVTGTVIEVVKGGLILDIGLRGFLPASLVEMRRVRDLHPYVGRELEAKVIELDKNRNNVVLSRRKFLEETQSEFRKEFLETLQKGEVRKGTVSSIVNFGSFVDLGGVDGLVHVSELSWKHIDHPGEVVEVGQEVEVEVLDVDLERERVSLSLKATQEDPWRQFARQHYVGEFIEGNVTKLVPFGAFVKVEDGIEGLIHISELAEAHVEVPEQVVKVNDHITVKIIDIDDQRRRISLSLKQAVKAGYGTEPDLPEEPAYTPEQPTTATPTSSSGGGDPATSAMGAAFADALRLRQGGDETASEDAPAEDAAPEATAPEAEAPEAEAPEAEAPEAVAPEAGAPEAVAPDAPAAEAPAAEALAPEAPADDTPASDSDVEEVVDAPVGGDEGIVVAPAAADEPIVQDETPEAAATPEAAEPASDSQQ